MGEGSRRARDGSLRSKHLFAAAAAALLAACTVGPQYVRPDAPVPTQFDQADASQQAGTPSRLWASFASVELDALIARALEANTSIAQAAAGLAETRALSGLSRFSLFPTVTSDAGAERSEASGDDPFAPPENGRTDRYRAGFDARWEIDLFGSLRNQRHAIERRVEADEAALADAQLAIVAETAQAWFALRGAQLQLQLRREQVGNLEQNLAMVQAMFDAGRANGLDLARARTQLQTVAAQLPQAEAEVVRHEQRLAVLTAWPVATLRSNLDAQPLLPATPVLATLGTPQAWLQRRPDIRAAERRLAAAYADIGYEQAQYFPILNLLGDFGWTAQTFGGLGDSANQRWSFGPSLTWRFLDFGRVRQNVRAAEARADAAEAAWQETVLRALEETENALAGLRAANRTTVELQAALDASNEALRLARLRFEAGASPYLDVLDAQRSQLDLQVQALDARVRQATALAAVYKALAGDFAAAPEA